jgi:putative oxidoreductase
VSWLRNCWLHRVLGVALGGIFLYAASGKILDPRPLVTIIWNYRILPAGPINLMAIYMPWMELVVGLALLSGFKRRSAAAWAVALLSSFTVALLINAARGIDVACGCFSTSAQDVQNAWLLVLRDLPMLLAALVMLLFPAAPRPDLSPQTSAET